MRAYTLILYSLGFNIALIIATSANLFPTAPSAGITSGGTINAIAAYGIAGLIGGMAGAVLASMFIPNSEKALTYGAFGAVFLGLWGATLLSIKGIQDYLSSQYDMSFPLTLIFGAMGVILFISAMLSMSGADIERG